LFIGEFLDSFQLAVVVPFMLETFVPFRVYRFTDVKVCWYRSVYRKPFNFDCIVKKKKQTVRAIPSKTTAT